jgi:hypothetical protein
LGEEEKKEERVGVLLKGLQAPPEACNPFFTRIARIDCLLLVNGPAAL